MPKKIYIIAGEASGDLHGSNLIKALKEESSSLQFRCWGGDKMALESGPPVKHIRDLAFMGFIEVLFNLRTILRNIDFCKKDILKFKPDLLVLIDYPGFNLRIAEWAKENGIKVAYYISPQVWAWKESRVKKIKKSVDHMYVILPFEKVFYQKHQFDVEYVGHPLLDAMIRFREESNGAKDILEKDPENKKILLVLPGSRKQEISVKLPIMLKGVESFSDYRVIVAGAPNLDEDFYRQFLEVKTEIIFNRTYDLLTVANLAVVTSGTATLETALFNVPEVVCYKGSSISYHIAKRLIRIKFISLVNLIMDKEVVRELIQHECNPELIEKELKALEDGTEGRKKMLEEFEHMREILGGRGASKKVAQSLLKTI